jgi:hypothetical protein
MPETRRTNPGFLSNNEAARDRKRTKDFVRGIVTSKELEEKSRERPVESKIIKKSPPLESDEIVFIDSAFWASNKGLIVKAIVLGRAYKKDSILRLTGLTDSQYRQAATALFNVGLLEEKYPGGLNWVDVKPLMEKYLDLPGLKVEIFSYVPSKTVVRKTATNKKLKSAKKLKNQRTLS